MSLKLVAALLLGGAVVQAATSQDPVRLCIEYAVQAPAPARAAFTQELRVLFANQRLRIDRRSCATTADVVLTVRSDRAKIPADALGLAFRQRTGIGGRLEVFLEPLMRETQAGCWETVGRARARVAGHELLHFLAQSAEHDESGLHAERVGRRVLTSKDNRPILVSRLHAARP